MGTVSNYADLQARIADEVLGAVTPAHIVNAIGDAIAKYERTRFYFNEVDDGLGVVQAEDQSSLTTSDGLPLTDANSLVTHPGQEFYAAPDYPLIGAMAEIDALVLVYGTDQRFPLRRRTANFMRDVSFSTAWRGMPTDWSWVSGAIRLYPIPDNAYPVIITGTARLPKLVNPADSNAWTCEAEELIRLCASGILYRRVIRDPAMAQMAMADEAQALASLRAETTKRGIGSGRIRPHGAV